MVIKTFILLLIHSLNNYLSNVSSVPGIMLGIRDKYHWMRYDIISYLKDWTKTID